MQNVYLVAASLHFVDYVAMLGSNTVLSYSACNFSVYVTHGRSRRSGRSGSRRTNNFVTKTIFVATPGLVSSARNTVRCLKPNGLGTRPRSSIYVYVRFSYARERNLSKKKHMAAPGLQSSYTWNLQYKARIKVPRQPILITEK